MVCWVKVGVAQQQVSVVEHVHAFLPSSATRTSFVKAGYLVPVIESEVNSTVDYVQRLVVDEEVEELRLVHLTILWRMGFEPAIVG